MIAAAVRMATPILSQCSTYVPWDATYYVLYAQDYCWCRSHGKGPWAGARN